MSTPLFIYLMTAAYFYLLGYYFGSRRRKREIARAVHEQYMADLNRKKDEHQFNEEQRHFNAAGWSVPDDATREKAIGDRRKQRERGLNA